MAQWRQKKTPAKCGSFKFFHAIANDLLTGDLIQNT